MTILFICSGNIHRSALAEGILRDEARKDGRSDLRVASAGVIAVDGMEVAREAAALARQAGLDLSRHRSRPVTKELLDQADMIVMMERFHHDWVSVNHPTALDRCRQLSAFAGDVTLSEGLCPGDDVPDAMGGDTGSFERSFGIIRDCVRRLYRELPPAPQEVYARAIEARFRSRRHAPMTLSPADFTLVEAWWNGGIPLWIVLESIDHMFARKEAAGTSSRVRRLGYVKSEVEERFEAYERSRTVGGSPGLPLAELPPDADGGLLLGHAARQLREAAAGARLRGQENAAVLFEQSAARVSADQDAATLAPAAARLRLHAMDDELLERIRTLVPDDEMARLHTQASAQLIGHRDRMTAIVFEATVARLVAEKIKELYGMPPLTQI